MRKILFHTDFISRYEDFPVAEFLRDFDDWLRAADYCAPPRLRPLSESSFGQRSRHLFRLLTCRPSSATVQSYPSRRTAKR